MDIEGVWRVSQIANNGRSFIPWRPPVPKCPLSQLDPQKLREPTSSYSLLLSKPSIFLSYLVQVENQLDLQTVFIHNHIGEMLTSLMQEHKEIKHT